VSRRPLLFSLIGIVLLAAGLFGGNLLAGNTPSLGLDLQGGASVTMTPKGTYDADALTVAVDIIRQRVDSIGVAEPEIIRQGDTVVVNLPGVKDQQQALELVGRTGAVEMRPVVKMADNPNNTTTTVAGSTTTTIKGVGADKTSLQRLLNQQVVLVVLSHIAADSTTTTTVPTVDPATGLSRRSNRAAWS
jgi:preprotein translocase subunit SecD